MCGAGLRFSFVDRVTSGVRLAKSMVKFSAQFASSTLGEAGATGREEVDDEEGEGDGEDVIGERGRERSEEDVDAVKNNKLHVYIYTASE